MARQRAVWERALELRILLQRCLAASHQLPRPEVPITVLPLFADLAKPATDSSS